MTVQEKRVLQTVKRLHSNLESLFRGRNHFIQNTQLWNVISTVGRDILQLPRKIRLPVVMLGDA